MWSSCDVLDSADFDDSIIHLSPKSVTTQYDHANGKFHDKKFHDIDSRETSENDDESGDELSTDEDESSESSRSSFEDSDLGSTSAVRMLDDLEEVEDVQDLGPSERCSAIESDQTDNLHSMAGGGFDDTNVSDEAWYVDFLESQGNVDDDQSDEDFWAQWDQDGASSNATEDTEEQDETDEQQGHEWEERPCDESDFKPVQTTKEIFVPDPDGVGARMVLITRQSKIYNAEEPSDAPPNWAWEMWDRRDMRLYKRGRKRRRNENHAVPPQLSSPLKKMFTA